MTLNQLFKQYEDLHKLGINKQIISVNRAYYDLSKELAPLLKSWKKPRLANAGVWTANKRIEKQIKILIDTFSKDLLKLIEQEQIRGFDLAHAKNDDFVKAYIKGLSISEIAKTNGLFTRNYEAMQAFQKRKINGLGLSDRIWKTTEAIKPQLEMFLETGLATGRSAKGLASDIKGYLIDPDKRFRRIKDPETGKLMLSQPAKKFNPGPGKYRSSYQNALRLTATETNMAYRYADHMRWKENEAVEGIEVRLSASHIIYDICDHMQGFYPKGFKFIGWHPRCFCYAVPVLMKAEDFGDYLLGERNPQPVTTIPIAAKRYVTDMTDRIKNYKSTPYWIKDNFKLSKGQFLPHQSIMKKAAYENL